MFFFLGDRERLPCDWGHFKIIPLLILKNHPSSLIPDAHFYPLIVAFL